MKGVEAIEPILKKTLLPANDRRCGGLQALLDGAEGRALGQQQDQFGAKDVSRWQAARLSDGSQFGILILGKQEFVASSHTNLEAQKLVMVTLRQATRFEKFLTKGRLRACSELQMFRSTFLAPSHYAGKWKIPDEDQRNDLKAVNALGYAYATAPDSPATEAMLL